jgi:hypothetical protein
MFDSLRRHLHALASIAPAQLVELTGPLRGHPEHIKALYAGNGANLDYVASSLFAQPPQRRVLGSVSIAFMADALKRHTSADVDVQIVERPPLWAHLGGAIGEIQIPAWVRQELRLDPAAATRWTLGRHLEREAQRQIRRHAYRLELSDAPAVKQTFFESFYLPYIQSRHRTGAITVSREMFDAVASTATLAQLFSSDRWIAGMLLHWRRDTLKFGWFGSAQTPPPSGASEVLDVLCVKMAVERGVSRIGFGSSRPSVVDGVARYKRKFGADFSLPRYPQTMIEFAISYRSQPVREWLCEQQFLCKVGNTLRVAGVSKSEPHHVEFVPVHDA